MRKLCERVLVLYLGRMMELAPAAALFAQPLHPYTRGLLDALLIPDPTIQAARLAHMLPGEPASALSPPPGCVFHTRCAHARDICRRRGRRQLPPGGLVHVEFDGFARRDMEHGRQRIIPAEMMLMAVNGMVQSRMA